MSLSRVIRAAAFINLAHCSLEQGEELKSTISLAEKYPELSKSAQKLNSAVGLQTEVTQHLLMIAGSKGPELFLADATLYLELFGIIAIAWQWLKQGIVCQQALGKDCSKKDIDFYQGKLYTMRYFYSYELPKHHALVQRLLESDGLTVERSTVIVSV